MSTWFSPLGEAKHHVKRTFVKKTKLKDTNARSNALTIHFSQISKANGFFNQKCKILQKQFGPHHCF
jgi:hypothetical protein